MDHLKNLIAKFSLFHLINVAALLGFVWIGIYFGPTSSKVNPWTEYGVFTLFLYLCRYLALLGLPQSVFNFLGLILFKSFPDPPQFEVKILHEISKQIFDAMNFLSRICLSGLHKYVFVWLLEGITLKW